MLSEKVSRQLQAFAAKHESVERLILFGSRALGDADERSDIDIAVDAPDMSQKEWLAFADNLEETIETLLVIDLVRLQDASPAFQHEIDKGKVIYTRNSSVIFGH